MDEEILKIFGNNLKVERVKRNLSQQDIAQLSGFSTPYISNIENAKHSISLDNALKLCEVLKLGIEYMIKKQF